MFKTMTLEISDSYSVRVDACIQTLNRVISVTLTCMKHADDYGDSVFAVSTCPDMPVLAFSGKDIVWDVCNGLIDISDSVRGISTDAIRFDHFLADRMIGRWLEALQLDARSLSKRVRSS